MSSRKEYEGHISIYDLLKSRPPKAVIDEIVRICRPKPNMKYTVKIKED